MSFGKALQLLFALLLTMTTAACSVLRYVGLDSLNDLDDVYFKSNVLCYPVAFDLVFIFDEKMVSTFTQLSGPQWFEQKDAMLLKYAANIKVVSLDVVANTPSTPVSLPSDNDDAYEIVLYANYTAKAGQVAATLGKFDTVTLVFNQDSYALSAGED